MLVVDNVWGVGPDKRRNAQRATEYSVELSFLLDFLELLWSCQFRQCNLPSLFLRHRRHFSTLVQRRRQKTQMKKWGHLRAFILSFFFSSSILWGHSSGLL